MNRPTKALPHEVAVNSFTIWVQVGGRIPWVVPIADAHTIGSAHRWV
jgi:hypothetical protein